jgi:hypothetical protein
MATLKGLKAIVLQLREQRTNFVNQIRHVEAALAVLGKLERGSSLAKPVRRISGAARRRIAAVQKARWAKWRSRKKR